MPSIPFGISPSWAASYEDLLGVLRGHDDGTFSCRWALNCPGWRSVVLDVGCIDGTGKSKATPRFLSAPHYVNSQILPEKKMVHRRKI